MSSPFIHLPPVLIPEILSFLPVKDLLRFRSVSCSWRSLIDSSYFRKLHLYRSQKTRSNLRILSIENHEIFSLLDFYSLEKVPDLKQPPLRKNSPYSHRIVGSCNGLIVLCSEHVIWSGRFLSLWNPSTRKFRKLPSPEIRVPESVFELNFVAYGFGYDSEKDDYKLVQSILFKTPDNEFSQAKVLSLKTNTWRSINCPFHIGCHGFTELGEALVNNNATHWLISWKHPVIVAFDFVKEEYYLVPPPKCPRAYSVCLCVLGGCLSMAIHPWTDWEQVRVDVWVMNEYGVKESWSKLFTLSLTSPPPGSFGSPRAVPLAYSRNGDRVLLNYCSRLSWYDLASKTVEFVRTDDEVLLAKQESRMYVGSLVWPRKNKQSSDGKLERNHKVMA